MSEPRDDELLDLLRDTLYVADLGPDDEARRRLRDALESDNVISLAGAARRTWRERAARHAGALTIAVSGVVALGGVAAAAVATDTLPGPTRAWAYDLGLPVTSPALYQARQQLGQLEHADSQHHAVTERQFARSLIRDLGHLNRHDLGAIRSSARAALRPTGLLSQVGGILGLSTSSTTTSTNPPSHSTTTTTTPPTSLVPTTIPSVGSVGGIGGSTGVGGTVNITPPNTSSLLP